MNELFDENDIAIDSPRIKAIKEHDIQTHHAEHCPDDPWLAIPMKLAKKHLHGNEAHPENIKTIGDICASIGALLDDHGLLFYGMSEREVQDAALEFVRNKQTTQNEKLDT